MSLVNERPKDREEIEQRRKAKRKHDIRVVTRGAVLFLAGFIDVAGFGYMAQKGQNWISWTLWILSGFGYAWVVGDISLHPTAKPSTSADKRPRKLFTVKF